MSIPEKAMAEICTQLNTSWSQLSRPSGQDLRLKRRVAAWTMRRRFGKNSEEIAELLNFSRKQVVDRILRKTNLSDEEYNLRLQMRSFLKEA